MAKVLAYISTKNRHEELYSAILSIAMQTRMPDRTVIFDDNDEFDLLKYQSPKWNHLFDLFKIKGTKLEVFPGAKSGQHYNHQTAQTMGCELCWRMDDDCFAEPSVLEALEGKFDADVGAVGGYILTPPVGDSSDAQSIIGNLYLPNVQWCKNQEAQAVDHLNCSFLYRAGVANYNLNLSPVAHREETMFSYEIKRAGYKVLFEPSATTWHFKCPSGGIRSHNSQFFYDHDEKIFQEKLKEWGIGESKVVYLKNGLGDNLMCYGLLDELKAKYANLVIATTYPEVWKDSGVTVIRVEEAKVNEDEHNIYKYAIDNKWTTSMIDLYRKMYL